jgi:hypothetical protein
MPDNTRTFTVPVVVSTTATDEELFAAARRTYEGHLEPGDEPIPTVQYAVADLVYEATGSIIAELLHLVDTLPASEDTPRVIGRDSQLMEGLAKLLRDATRKRHEYGELRETRRGYVFEVRLFDPDRQPTGRIARVTAELDRVEP